MTGYLVDTNVISARKDEALAQWLDRAAPLLWLSSVTAAEVTSGIARKRREGASRQAAEIADWWQAIVHLYRERILPFDLDAATIAGERLDHARATGRNPGFADIAIAATALSRGLVVLTRNRRHFEPIGVNVIDPFESLPPLPD